MRVVGIMKVCLHERCCIRTIRSRTQVIVYLHHRRWGNLYQRRGVSRSINS